MAASVSANRLRLGRLEDAIRDYDQVLAKKARYATSLFGRALAWAGKGDMAKAETDRAEALKQNAQVQREFEDYGLHWPEEKR